MIVFTVPLRIKGLNPTNRLGVGRNITPQKLRRQRFAARGEVNGHRAAGYWGVHQASTAGARAELVRAERMVVTLTRLGVGTLDGDNLRGGLKAVRDGIAQAFQVDDADPRWRWMYAQERAASYAVRVTIEAMTKGEVVRLVAEREAAT